jgi:hypothetical protein
MKFVSRTHKTFGLVVTRQGSNERGLPPCSRSECKEDISQAKGMKWLLAFYILGFAAVARRARLLAASANLSNNFKACLACLARIVDARQEQMPQHAAAYASPEIRIVELAAQRVAQFLGEGVEPDSVAVQRIVHEPFTSRSRIFAGLLIADGRPRRIQHS